MSMVSHGVARQTSVAIFPLDGSQSRLPCPSNRQILRADSALTMPRFIRQALGERIRSMREVQEFRHDFLEATGLEMRFLDSLGHGGTDEPAPYSCALCERLHADDAGRRICTRFTQALLQEAVPEGTTRRCDAGLHETAVPVHLGGQDVGYFVFGPMADPDAGRVALNRASHLLGCAGVTLATAELATLTAAAPVAGSSRRESLRRLVAAWVDRFTREFSHDLARPPAELPAPIEQVCRYVRTHYAERLDVSHLARHAGLSAGHLSRQFHRSTGLRLVDYIARVRIEYAREALVGTTRPITEIAHACGFGSLSQFNRLFRRVTGRSPRELRQAAASPAATATNG